VYPESRGQKTTASGTTSAGEQNRFKTLGKGHGMGPRKDEVIAQKNREEKTTGSLSKSMGTGVKKAS